jgi:predicted peptidase
MRHTPTRQDGCAERCFESQSAAGVRQRGYRLAGLAIMVAAPMLLGSIDCAAADNLLAGDLHLSYALSEANGQTMPYRVYVPSNIEPGQRRPLLVVLHGYGGNADSPFADAQGLLQEEAGRHGFIVVSPNGYDGLADYGANLPLPSAIPGAKKTTLPPEEESRLAEADVLHVINKVAGQFPVDPRRVYLMGNSMGMTGVLHFASKFPDRWCAISASGGPPWPNYPVERLKGLAGALFIHGAKDDLSRLSDSQDLTERARSIGIDARLRVMPEGTHGNAWIQYLPQTFEFFAENTCSGK